MKLRALSLMLVFGSFVQMGSLAYGKETVLNIYTEFFFSKESYATGYNRLVKICNDQYGGQMDTKKILYSESGYQKNGQYSATGILKDAVNAPRRFLLGECVVQSAN